jgi:LacI family transcriptional regulator
MATIKDVAKLAGVSYNTVSFVVNGVDKVAPATRERVQKAIEELRYRPNKTARALVGGKADSIAFISTRFTSVFGMNILREIEDGVHLAGLSSNYDLIPYSTRGSVETKAQILDSISQGRKADVVIMLGLKPEKQQLKNLRDKKAEVVLIDEKMQGVHSINSDNKTGAFIAAELLINKGRRSIAYIGGPKGTEETGISYNEREQGFKEALAAAGLTFRDSLLARSETFFINEGRALMTGLLKKGIKIDGLFCGAGDNVALGAMEAIRDAGLRVPEDISVIGYGDIAAGSVVTPKLTTVKEPYEKIGNEAFGLALEIMKGKIKGIKNVVFKPELIIRSSV